MLRCRQEAVGAGLGGHRQVCGPRSEEDSIVTVQPRIQDEEARQCSKSLTCFSVVLWNATSRSGEGPFLKGKPSKLRHYDISRAHPQGTAQRLIYIRRHHRGSSEVWRRQSWQIDQEHVRNSRCFPHLAT